MMQVQTEVKKKRIPLDPAIRSAWLTKIATEFNQIMFSMEDKDDLETKEKLTTCLLRMFKTVPMANRNIRNTYLYRFAMIIQQKGVTDWQEACKRMADSGVPVEGYKKKVILDFPWMLEIPDSVKQPVKRRSLLKLKEDKKVVGFEALMDSMNSIVADMNELKRKLEEQTILNKTFSNQIIALKEEVKSVFGVVEEISTVKDVLAEHEHGVRGILVPWYHNPTCKK